jgi:hypothetical protein
MPGRNGTPNEEQHGIEAEVIAVELKAAFKLPDTQAVIRLVKHRRRLGRQGRLSRSDTGRSAGRGWPSGGDVGQHGRRHRGPDDLRSADPDRGSGAAVQSILRRSRAHSPPKGLSSVEVLPGGKGILPPNRHVRIRKSRNSVRRPAALFRHHGAVLIRQAPTFSPSPSALIDAAASPVRASCNAASSRPHSAFRRVREQ